MLVWEEVYSKNRLLWPMEKCMFLMSKNAAASSRLANKRSIFPVLSHSVYGSVADWCFWPIGIMNTNCILYACKVCADRFPKELW